LLDIVGRLAVEIPSLVDVLPSGTASSVALQALGTAITPANPEQLSSCG
jgi:hypothetical protein